MLYGMQPSLFGITLVSSAAPSDQPKTEFMEPLYTDVSSIVFLCGPEQYPMWTTQNIDLLQSCSRTSAKIVLVLGLTSLVELSKSKSWKENDRGTKVCAAECSDLDSHVVDEVGVRILISQE